MKPSALNQWRSCVLGAVNGLLFTGAYALVEWLYRRHLEAISLKEDAPNAGFNILMSDLRDPIWYWYGRAAWFVMLFTIGSFIAHRYLLTRLKAPLALWLVIGLGVIAVWNLLGLAGAYHMMWDTGFTVMYQEVTSPASIQFGLNSFILVGMLNLIYGGIIQLSARQYSQQRGYSSSPGAT